MMASLPGESDNCPDTFLSLWKIILDCFSFVWQVSLVSSSHTCASQQTFEEIRININQCLLVYALVILIPLPLLCHFLLWFLFTIIMFVALSSGACFLSVVFVHYYHFCCSPHSPAEGRNRVLAGHCHCCLAQFLSQFLARCFIIFVGWMNSHFIKKWVTEKSKYLLNFIETEPESVSYISESICPFLHWALFNTVCPKW